MTLLPALVVPDEQTWTIAGRDPASLGVEPVFSPAAVRRVLVADRLPAALAEPLERYLESVPLEAGRAQSRPADHHSGHDHQGGHEGHDGHAEHDHHDMMAIVGEPSADGLVMEPINVRYGPLGTPLPGGLLANVILDGDVVSECDVTSLLAADDDGEVPDPLAPQAWSVARATGTEAVTGVGAAPSERWNRIARVEVERALSHTAWLRGFARLLGWRALIEHTSATVASILEGRSLRVSTLREIRAEVELLSRLLHDSRWLRLRTAGRARLTAGRARELGVRGPAARASGLHDDARLDDPLYRALRFEPIVRSEGDALARTLVRGAEAAAAIQLAIGAIEASAARDLSEALSSKRNAATVEGPRGPVQAHLDGSEWRQIAQGQDAALTAAGATVVGNEWAGALIGIASFDLSPWKVTS